MADYGAVLAWNSPRQGREAKALEVFVEAQAMFEKAQANGLIDSFETVLFQATGGALPGGMTIAWGSEDEMDAWRRNDDYVRLQNQATLVADGSLIQMKNPPCGRLISTSVPSSASQRPRSIASRLAR